MGGSQSTVGGAFVPPPNSPALPISELRAGASSASTYASAAAHPALRALPGALRSLESADARGGAVFLSALLNFLARARTAALGSDADAAAFAVAMGVGGDRGGQLSASECIALSRAARWASVEPTLAAVRCGRGIGAAVRAPPVAAPTFSMEGASGAADDAAAAVDAVGVDADAEALASGTAALSASTSARLGAVTRRVAALLAVSSPALQVDLITRAIEAARVSGDDEVVFAVPGTWWRAWAAWSGWRRGGGGTDGDADVGAPAQAPAAEPPTTTKSTARVTAPATTTMTTTTTTTPSAWPAPGPIDFTSLFIPEPESATAAWRSVCSIAGVAVREGGAAAAAPVSRKRTTKLFAHLFSRGTATAGALPPPPIAPPEKLPPIAPLISPSADAVFISREALALFALWFGVVNKGGRMSAPARFRGPGGRGIDGTDYHQSSPWPPAPDGPVAVDAFRVWVLRATDSAGASALSARLKSDDEALLSGAEPGVLSAPPPPPPSLSLTQTIFAAAGRRAPSLVDVLQPSPPTDARVYACEMNKGGGAAELRLLWDPAWLTRLSRARAHAWLHATLARTAFDRAPAAEEALLSEGVGNKDVANSEGGESASLGHVSSGGEDDDDDYDDDCDSLASTFDALFADDGSDTDDGLVSMTPRWTSLPPPTLHGSRTLSLCIVPSAAPLDSAARPPRALWPHLLRVGDTVDAKRQGAGCVSEWRRVQIATLGPSPHDERALRVEVVDVGDADAREFHILQWAPPRADARSATPLPDTIAPAGLVIPLVAALKPAPSPMPALTPGVTASEGVGSSAHVAVTAATPQPTPAFPPTPATPPSKAVKTVPALFFTPPTRSLALFTSGVTAAGDNILATPPLRRSAARARLLASVVVPLLRTPPPPAPPSPSATAPASDACAAPADAPSSSAPPSAVALKGGRAKSSFSRASLKDSFRAAKAAAASTQGVVFINANGRPDALVEDGASVCVGGDDTVSTAPRGGASSGVSQIPRPSARAAQAPSPTARTVIRSVAPGSAAGLLAGIRNIGNTCYLAAALQALAAVPELRSFFGPRGAWRAALGLSRDGHGGDLAASFSSLLKDSAAPTGAAAGIEKELRRLALAGAGALLALPQRLPAPLAAALTPAPIKAVAARANPFVFGNREQQDAQEALSFLLDGLHEDVNAVGAGGKPSVPDADAADISALRRDSAAACADGLLPALAAAGSDEFVGDAALAADAWRRHSLRNNSRVSALSVGQLASRVSCDACGVNSIRFDTFNLLSLPVPMAAPAGAVGGEAVAVAVGAGEAASASTSSAVPTVAEKAPALIRIMLTIFSNAFEPTEVVLEVESTATARAVAAALGALCGSASAPTSVSLAFVPRPLRASGSGGTLRRARPVSPTELISAACADAAGALIAFDAGVGAPPPPSDATSQPDTDLAPLELLQSRPSASAPSGWRQVGAPLFLPAGARASSRTGAGVWALVASAIAPSFRALARALFVALGCDAALPPDVVALLDAVADAPAFFAARAAQSSDTQPVSSSRRGTTMIDWLVGGVFDLSYVIPPAQTPPTPPLPTSRRDGEVAAVLSSHRVPLMEADVVGATRISASSDALSIPTASVLVLSWSATTVAELCASLCVAAGVPTLPVATPAHASLSGWAAAAGVKRASVCVSANGAVALARSPPPPADADDLTFLATASWRAVAEAAPGLSELGARPLGAPSSASASSLHPLLATSARARAAVATTTASGSSSSAAAGFAATVAVRSDDAQWIPLASLLRSFLAPERLTVADGCGWKCPRCVRDVDATKTLALWSPPRVLAVHLKRFFFEKGTAQKVPTPVDAPLVLDLASLAVTTGPPTSLLRATRLAGGSVTAAATAEAAALRSAAGGAGVAVAAAPASAAVGNVVAPAPARIKVALSAGGAAALPMPTPPPPATSLPYDLIAVVNHHGENQWAGHYTATYRHDVAGSAEGDANVPCWVHADDARLSLVAVGNDPARVLPAVVTPDAYLLVYRARE